MIDFGRWWILDDGGFWNFGGGWRWILDGGGFWTVVDFGRWWILEFWSGWRWILDGGGIWMAVDFGWESILDGHLFRTGFHLFIPAGHDQF